MAKSKRVLSVFSLVMINVIAVDSLRTLPITAKLGFSLISYYLAAAIIFFIPVALVAAELATAYPSTGGIYIWVREAFGVRTAFITIWLQWIYNVVWYPTMMAFIAATMAYLFNPALANNKFYLLSTIIPLFWLFTLMNCFGMKISSLISNIGAIFGTLIPMFGIAILGGYWILSGGSIATDPHQSWLPDFSSLANISMLIAVLFGLLGMEMSAVHAEEVKNPQRDYPRALLYSTLIIFSSLVLGSLAIIVVIPSDSSSVVSGLIDAYAAFFNNYQMQWMTLVTAGLIILGGLAGVSAWIIGPTKGLLISAHDKCLPSYLTQVNKHGVPVRILIAQALIFTLLSSVFILIDSINGAYWLLSVLCGQLALMVYIFMFAAAIRLRYTQPHQPRAYTIPGGKIGIWCIAGLGLICCLCTILLGFIPPSQIPLSNRMLFESYLVGGMVIFIIIPWLLASRYALRK